MKGPQVEGESFLRSCGYIYVLYEQAEERWKLRWGEQ